MIRCLLKLARLTLFLSCAIALSPIRSSAQEQLRIPYGVTTSLQHLPILVGKDSGLFAKYGLNVEPIHIRGGALITTMIMSGTVQFSGAGAESVVSARIEGGDVALIACPADTDVVYFVARPEIKSAAKPQRQEQRRHPARLDDSFLFARGAALLGIGSGKGHDDISNWAAAAKSSRQCAAAESRQPRCPIAIPTT